MLGVSTPPRHSPFRSGRRPTRDWTAVALLLGFVLAVATACGSSEPSRASAQLTVMTQNLFIGTDVSPVLSASDPADLAEVIDALFAQAQASNFPARAEVIARVIAEHRPDVIGLQEVALWRVQEPADGTTSPAKDVAFDFLALLLAALDERGLSYTASAVREGVDLEVSGSARDVRLTDHDVVLVRDGLEVVSSEVGTFATNLTLPSPLGSDVTVPRGWAAVDLEIGSTAVRVVTTHLEVNPFVGIQEQQATELREKAADVKGPVIVLGDLNAEPGSSTSDVVGVLLGDDLFDAWLAADADHNGATCCYASNLAADSGELVRRIDLVVAGRGARAVAAARLLDAEIDQTDGGLWPSDHAGVVATIELR